MKKTINIIFCFYTGLDRGSGRLGASVVSGEMASAKRCSWTDIHRFASKKELFPDGEFSTYIAPSNTLCPTARQWLPMALPELQVISSYYLPDEDGVLFVQEFSESADGIVNFPRISFGYDPPSYVRWAAINELGLHYVNSHFFSPNDVLSDAETLQRGWEICF